MLAALCCGFGGGSQCFYGGTTPRTPRVALCGGRVLVSGLVLGGRALVGGLVLWGAGFCPIPLPIPLSLSGLGLVHVHFGLGGRGLVGVCRS
jgi:hypothetical protein